jgi:diamine N-acetyltransferase
MSGSGARIERLLESDVAQLAALAREIWFDHYVGIITTAQIEYMLEQRYNAALVRAELTRDDIWWDKLSLNAELIGFASYMLTQVPGEMKLDKLYVRTRWQRRGYGGLLITRACDVARQRGCTRLTLAVNKNNRTAIAAYLKHGFHVADSVVKDIGGGFVMDDYIMERSIL